MAQQGGRIDFQIGFKADKSGIQDLKKSLQQIQKIKPANFDGTNQDLQEIKSTAKEVEAALSKAFNPNINSINLKTFDNELKSSGKTINDIYASFSKAGAQGQVAFSQMARSVLTTNQQLKQTHSLINQMGTTMVNTIKWGIASSVMNTFTSSVQNAFTYVESLEKSLTNIRIVTGDSQEKMDQFADSANRAAQELGRSTMDYSKAALTFYQQGLGDEDVQARTEAVLKAQNITGAGSEMADYLTAVWNGYKVANEQAQVYVDKLAAVADSSASDMSQLAVAMSKVASTANTLGVDADQLNAQLATVIATTRQAPEAVGTAFKTIYTRMNDIKAGTEDAQISLGNYSGKMAELGFNVLDATGHLRDTGQVMQEIGSRWDTLTKEQQIYLATTMGGQRQVNQLIALFDNWTTYSELLNTSLESEGTLAQKNSIYLESLGAKMEQLGAAGERVKASLIDSESFGSVIELLTTGTNLLGGFIQAIGGGGTALLGLGGIATQVFSGVISKEINNAIVNFQNMKSNIQQGQKEIALTEQFGQSQGYQQGAINEMLDAKRQMQEFYSVMSVEQRNSYNAIVEQIGATKEQILLQQEKVDKAKEFVRALEQAGREEGLDFEGQSIIVADEITKITQALENLKESGSRKEKLEIFDAMIDQVDQLQVALGDLNNIDITNAFTKLEQLKTKRQQLLEQRNDIAVIDVFGQQEYDAKTKQIDIVQQKIQKAVANIKNSVNEVSNLQVNMDVHSENIKQAERQLENLKKKAEQVQRQMSQGLTVSNIVQGVGEIGRATSALMALGNSIKIIFDDSVPPVEKFFKVIMSSAYAIPTLVTSFQKLQTITKAVSAATVNATKIQAAKNAIQQAQVAVEKEAAAAKGANVVATEGEAAATAGSAAATGADTAVKVTDTAATKALTVAQEALNVAMASNPIGLILLGITALGIGIAGAVAAYDHFTTSVDEAHQAIDNFNKKAEQTRNTVKEYSTNISNLQGAKSEWDKLSQRAGYYNSTIDNLTEEEKARYYELSDLIAQYNGDAVIGYDEQGHAILQNNKALEDTIALLKEKRQLELDNTYDSKEYKDAQKGRQISYNSAKENQSLTEDNIQSTTKDLTDKLQARGHSLSIAFQGLNKKTQQDFADEIKRLDQIMALGAEGIFQHREELIGLFEKFQQNGIIPADYDTASVKELQNLNQYLDNSRKDLDNINKEVSNYEKANTQQILERLQTSDYNQLYNKAEAVGITNINGILSSYIQGLSSIDKNGQYLDTDTLAQTVNDKFLSPFMMSLGQVGQNGNTLYQNLINSIASDKELNKAESTFAEKNNHIQEIVQNFLNENNSNLKSMFDAAKEDPEVEKAFQQIFANMFNIENLDIDFNTGKVENVVNQKIQNITDRITENITQGLSLEEQASLNLPTNEIIESLLPSDITDEELDSITERIEALIDKTGSWKQALQQATSYALTAENLSQNLNTVNLANKQNQGENLSKEQSQKLQTGLAQLQRIYPELDQAVKILSQDQLAGTAQYQAALQDVNNTLIESTLHAIKMADDGGEAIKTAYTEGLTSAAQAIDAFEAGVLTSGDKINDSLAYTANYLSELDDLLGYGAISGEAFGAALQTVSDKEAASYGLDVDKYQDYVSLLRATNEEYANNEFLARQVAIANERIAKGTEDLIDNWDDWNDTISDYINSGEDVLALADDWGELKEAIANTFNMQPEAVDMLGPDFVAENWDKIQQVKDGVEGAWEELDALMSQTLVLNAYGVADFSELDQNIQDAYNAIQDLDGTNVSIVAGMEGTDDILDAFQTIADGAHWTSTQAQAAFSQMGYNVEVQEKPDAMHSQTEETQYYVPPTYEMKSVPFSLGPFGTSGAISYPTITQEAHYQSAGGGTKQSYEPGAYTIKSITSNGKSSGGKISRKTAGNHGKGSGSGKGKGGKGKKGGGKKGKSSTPKTPKVQKPITDKPDRYHDINLKLKDIDNDLNKVQKQQDKLTGKDLLKNLNEQLKLLEKQVATYKEKIQLEKQQADQIRNRLKKQGVTFDANGNISNYAKALTKALNEYNKTVAKYNKMSAEEQQKNKDMLNKAKQKYENTKKDIQRYDKIVSEEIPNLQKAVQEAVDKQTQINIQKFKIKVDLEMDMSEAEREFNEFTKTVKKQLRDDDILGNAQAYLKDYSSYYKGGYDVIQALTDQIRNTRNQINNIDKQGSSSVYGKDRAAAIKDLQEYTKELMSNLEDIEDVVANIKDTIFDAIDKAQDAFDEQKKEYEYIADLIEHNQKVVELLYGEDAYNQLQEYYKLQQKNNKNQLDFLRQQKEMWYSRMEAERKRMNSLPEGTNAWKEANDRFEEYKRHWMDSLDEINGQIEDALENLIDKYTNAVDKIFLVFENNITSGKGLENISEEWQLIGKQADQYLDKVNSMYQIDKLENAYRDAIDDNDGNLKAQQSLNNLMNEQLKYLKDKDKLTQYDVDRANALLQIEIKRLALEQARQSKTKLRLRRDSQGNYTYQYTADEDATRQAQQELADAENSLYNLTKQSYKNNLDDYYDTTEEMNEKIRDVYKDTTLSAEEQNQKIAMLYEYYGDIINGLTQQNEDLKRFMMEDTFNEMAKMYDTNVQNFKNMTDEEKDILMNDMVPYWKSSIQDMADTFAGAGGFGPITQDLFKDLIDNSKDYQDSLDEIGKIAGVSLEQIKNATDINIQRAETLLEKNDELINSYNDEMSKVQQVINKVNQLTATYQKAKNEAIQATNAAYNFNQQNNANTVNSLVTNRNVAGSAEYATAASFDTGGYTGDWGDIGKAAILHEKEIVLNSYDTANLLSAVKITRTLDNILSNFTIKPFTLGNVINNNNNNSPSETQQNITIHADFPNVTEKSQIEAAFNNLVNKASQYAFNTKR